VGFQGFEPCLQIADFVYMCYFFQRTEYGAAVSEFNRNQEENVFCGKKNKKSAAGF